MSTTPARFRMAGAERRPLKSERPAYDFSLMEPAVRVRVKNSYDGRKGREYLAEAVKFGRIR